jgi:hypothetical protein
VSVFLYLQNFLNKKAGNASFSFFCTPIQRHQLIYLIKLKLESTNKTLENKANWSMRSNSTIKSLTPLSNIPTS